MHCAGKELEVRLSPEVVSKIHSSVYERRNHALTSPMNPHEITGVRALMRPKVFFIVNGEMFSEIKSELLSRLA